MIDTCVNCGKYVPEGQMVCSDCADRFVASEISDIDRVLFTLWNWKVYQENKSWFCAKKGSEKLTVSSLEKLVELIIAIETGVGEFL